MREQFFTRPSAWKGGGHALFFADAGEYRLYGVDNVSETGSLSFHGTSVARAALTSHGRKGIAPRILIGFGGSQAHGNSTEDARSGDSPQCPRAAVHCGSLSARYRFTSRDRECTFNSCESIARR